MPLDPTLLAQLPDTLTVDIDGKPSLLRDQPFVKDATDFPAFVRGAYDAHREVGARIPVKHDGKPESIAEWRKTHVPTLQKAGLLPVTPASPEEYGITRPAEIPEGLAWDDARATRYAALAHKHGVSKEAAQDFMNFHLETLKGVQGVIKSSYDEGMTALKKEYGDKFDERSEQASRLAAAIFKTDEELQFFETVGLANHPTFMSVLMRLAPLAESDSSVLAGLGASTAGGLTGEAVRNELADIMSNLENPKHKLYWQHDKATMEYVDSLYKKVYGDGKVQIGGPGVNVGEPSAR